VPEWAWAKIANPDGTRWAIPERDATGEVIGTAYRHRDDRKSSATGGKRGLILPWPLDPYAGTAAADPVFITEGASDAAALLGLALTAVGVPMAGQCGGELAALLAGRYAVLVADADDAGRRGAARIADALAGTCAGVRIIEPPEGAKDARGAVIAGADRGAFMALADAAPAHKPEAGTPDAAGGDDGDKSTQSEQLVRLTMELCRLGQTPKREPFAVMNTGPNVAGMLRGSGGWLRDVLAREYRRRFGRVPNATAYSDAIAVLRGEALNAPTESVSIRVGPHGNGVVLDLGTVDGAAAVVDASGWRIVDRSPILFQRTALTGMLPTPDRGGRLDALRDLLNVTDETWPILLGWMVAALIPEMPHPILMLGGLQGTGKTTAARYICGVFDPSDAMTRAQPRDPEAWAMSVANGWATVIDNISSIPDWWSDALCKVVTGDGWVRRTLYSDGDVSVMSFRRVVVLTSIDAGALRGDLGERLVLVDLEPIAPERRRTEKALDKAYDAARPAILGALMDLLAGVLSRLDSVSVPTLPRMADFARVLAAVDATLGTNSLALYADQGKRIAGEVLDADPVGEAVAAWARQHGDWSGTASELLKGIRPGDAGREWPSTGRGLGARLKRLAPALSAQGIRVTPPPPTDRKRVYRLQAIAQTAEPPENGAGATENVDSGLAVGSTQPPNRPCNRPRENPFGAPGNVDSRRLGDSGGRAPESADTGDDPSEPCPAAAACWPDGSPIGTPPDDGNAPPDAGDGWGEIRP